MELRVEGEPGVLDAEQSLRVLTMLAEVVGVVSPEGTELPLVELRTDSGVAVIGPSNITSHSLLERVQDALQHPTQLTRRLRRYLNEAFETRAGYGITGFGFAYGDRTLRYDSSIYRRVEVSLSRPTGWASVSGEVRSVGRSQTGISGKVRDAIGGHVVNFEAPADMEDELRDVLFRRAALSGQTEVDEAGAIRRIVVERVESIGETTLLASGEFMDVPFDGDATLTALQELRRG